MALSKRDRRALILGGAGLGLVAIYVLAIEPLAKAYDDLVADHQRLAAKVARTIRDKRKAEYFAKQLGEYEKTAGKLSGPKPYDEQITTIGEQMIAAAQACSAKAAKDSKIRLRGSTPTAAVPWADDPTLEMALFHIDAEVGWETVFKFIASLYRIPGVLSVERLDLSGDPKKGGKIKLRLTVSVLTAATPKKQDLWAR